VSETIESNVVTIEQKGDVAILWLDRPEVLNAISLDVKRALADSITALDGNNDIRSIVLAGRGRAFCAGADRKLLAQLGTSPRAARIETLKLGAKVTEVMLRCETPIVAAVQGYAVGGGISLALAADIVLAAKDTVFFIPEVELGLPYMWGSTAMLAATMGMHRARDLTLTCERFGAEDAERWGLVRAIIPEADLIAEAEKTARRLAAMPRQSLTAQMRLNNRLALRYREWLEDEITLFLDIEN